MTENLLDECHQSILKIAETQPPDGKRAILIMAEMFRVNSGSASSEEWASSSQDVHARDEQPKPSHQLHRASR
jgi:hypothetical protein